MPIIDAGQLFETSIDYLIVGGGTSGLAVAARLSEDPKVTVAVIEAGDYHKGVPEVDLPGLATRAFGNPKFDWAFCSTPQVHANNREVFQARGKGLGGSSMLHLMVMSQGSKADFDALEALGNPGWNWEEILRYTKRSETLVPLTDPALASVYRATLNERYHGTDGPILKSFSPWYSPLQTPVFEALAELGVPINPDPASGVNVGTSTGLGTVDPSTATRSYAASGYYEPNSTRKNLVILTNALVSKLVFENDDSGRLPRAIGADFIVNGRLFELRGVRKEVILSAGSFQTPALLELSGIGNPKLLKKHGIPVVVDLPGVGENLQDHTLTFSVMEVDSTLDSLDALYEPEFLADQMEKYQEQKGMLSSVVCQTFSYVPASTFESPETIKRWQEDTTTAESVSIPSLQKQYDIMRPWISDGQQAQVELLGLPGHMFTPLSTAKPGKRYYTFGITLMHPLSRGSVHITSPDPEKPPAIDPNYFAHHVDLEMLTDGLKFSLQLFDTEPMKSATIAPVMPSRDIIEQGEHALREYVKDTVGPEFHPLGTAAMLPRSDGGVVDPELKVYGTANLRVVDCSILPLEISAHLQSVAYAIGEKAADIIKATTT
ncbi:GMC oxidoreductase [Auriscalpium vulgare]|uniref:GMC oxidoreductase n=2 Tax=Auriscalpium vulgare TaxID=40419 RepID=A0ACB8R5G5_9AGAM|nr:GMC oxidoreductase [Auriscalpium vulgare]